MRKLELPSISGREKEIYVECASDFLIKEEYARIALSYADEVEKCSSKYMDYIPHDIENFPYTQVSDKHKIIIEKVYSQKFSRENSIGRKYYNVIVNNAGRRCPICGGGKIKNLDHFLPQSEYPLLCVTVANLIPTCRDCNMEKGASTSNDYYELPFHPYFDTMTECWVGCDVIFYEDGTFSIKFKNAYDKLQNPQLWRKYTAHMKRTDLALTFNCRAEEELENVKEMYQRELRACGKDKVKASLVEEMESAEIIDVNSWKSALYRELLKECDAFCEWLIQ